MSTKILTPVHGITGKTLTNAPMRSKIGKRTGGGDNLISPGIRP
jgi:hypothetical protein